MVRVTTRWDGFPGSPGYTNFYADGETPSPTDVAEALTVDIKAYWLATNGYLPADVTVTVLPIFQVMDPATGNITDEGTVATPATPVTGTSGADYAGNAGVAVNWNTATFIGGRRLKGRTYFVPYTGVFQNNGTLSTAAMADITAQANTLATGSPGLVVWHRPIAGAGGSFAPVTSATVRDRAAHLRSRSL
jgi:hypothetical protein